MRISLKKNSMTEFPEMSMNKCKHGLFYRRLLNILTGCI